MKESVFSMKKIGLRGKIIVTMTTALAGLMLLVGSIVFVQVSKQLRASMEEYGKGLVKGFSTANNYWFFYESKKEIYQGLKDIVNNNEQVIYAIAVLSSNDQTDWVGGYPVKIFSSYFSEDSGIKNEEDFNQEQLPNLDPEVEKKRREAKVKELIENHMQNQGRVFESDDYIGFAADVGSPGSESGNTKAVESKGKQPAQQKPTTDEVPQGVLGDKNPEEGTDDEIRLLEGENLEEEQLDEEAMIAPGLEEESAEPAQKNVQTTDSSSKDVFGYVFIGLDTSKLQKQKIWLLQTLTLVLFLAIGLFSLFLYWASSKMYQRMLLMMEVARRISQGDLSESVPEVSADEIGMLSEALNRITNNLNDMIGKIAQVTEGLGDAVEQITAATEEIVQGAEYQVASVDQTSSSMSEMVISLRGVAENVEVLATSAEESSSSIMEMAATNDEVADNVNKMMSSVEETATNIEQMTEAVKEVAKNVEDLSATSEQTSTSMREMDVSIRQVEINANETASLSEEVRADAERGSDAVKKTRQGIAQIRDSTRTAFLAMEALGKKVQAIGQVLTVIDDVAEQTNLLALNAAIIAAQAGEHGKGFAVVADEIKDLAERTAASTSEIAELIQAVQSETKSVLSSMDAGRESVSEGVKLSGDAEEALRKILESVTKSTQMVREIARATVEQARGSKVVTDAMSRIAETVQQIAASTSQQAKGSEQIMNSAEQMKLITQHVHSSSQEQARGSRQITQAMENISEMVHHLNRAQKEQAKGAEQVMEAVEKIKEIAEHHSDAMGNMKKTVDQVAQQAETLRDEMGRFKL